MRHYTVTRVTSSEPRGPRVTRLGSCLGALGTALLLVTAACSTDDAKGVTCKGAAAIDNLFGVSGSEGNAKDCGGGAHQSAGRTGDAAPATIAGNDLSTDRSVVTDLQKRLNELGYDAGPADGQMGPKTRTAIRSYQKKSGVAPDGRLTASLMERIRADSPG